MTTFRALPPALAPYVEKEFWGLWRRESGQNGKLTKVPYQSRRPSEHASSKNSTTWSDFATAQQAYEAGHGDGIVFCLLGSGLTAFDLDDCRNATTGEIEPAARDLIKRAKSYVEITPSGAGLRIIGKGSGPSVQRKQPVPNGNGMTVESYRNCARFITITGDALPEATAELADNDALIEKVVAELDKAKAKAKQARGRGGKQGGKGKRKKKLDLDDIIKNGEGGHFGGDRSKAVWFVINRLIEQSKSADEIVAVLLDHNNRISEHLYDHANSENYARAQVDKAQTIPRPRSSGSPSSRRSNTSNSARARRRNWDSAPVVSTGWSRLCAKSLGSMWTMASKGMKLRFPKWSRGRRRSMARSYSVTSLPRSAATSSCPITRAISAPCGRSIPI